MKSNNPIERAAHIQAGKMMRKALCKETAVRVRLVRDDVTDVISIEVGVRSNTRSTLAGQLWGNALIDANESQDHIRYMVAHNAERICNFQNGAYGDMHNPPAVANQAQAALADIFRAAERASTRAPIGKSSEQKGLEG